MWARLTLMVLGQVGAVDTSHGAGTGSSGRQPELSSRRAPTASLQAARISLLRQVVADVAVAQVRQPDAQWHDEQRDCAGLIRFALRQAYKRVEPQRLHSPLFEAATGPVEFADAQTLLAFSFAPLGRDESARRQLRSGDIVAFRQPRDEGEVYHLMLVVRPGDSAHAEPFVVYHPGEADAAVRVGPMAELTRDAPGEWRPVTQNPSFLGFFRFKEWHS